MHIISRDRLWSKFFFSAAFPLVTLTARALAVLMWSIFSTFCTFSAIVSFSMESLRKDSPRVHGEQKQKSKLGQSVHQIVVNLPADYGRRPLSEDEMDIINVSIIPTCTCIYISIKCPGLKVGIKSTRFPVENNPVWLGGWIIVKNVRMTDVLAATLYMYTAAFFSAIILWQQQLWTAFSLQQSWQQARPSSAVTLHLSVNRLRCLPFLSNMQNCLFFVQLSELCA